MPKLKEVKDYLDFTLSNEKYRDFSLNGLVLDSGNREIKKIAAAVDSGLSIIEKAIENKADLLIVHHGLFWGEAKPLTSSLGEKIKLLFKAGCSLYVSHLPLDAHKEVGNNALLANFFSLTNLSPCSEIEGMPIGCYGDFPTTTNLNNLKELGEQLTGVSNILSLPFGKKDINSAMIVSGSAASSIYEAKKLEVDVFISGEPKQQVYHDAKELKMNAIFFGHYATETMGVRELASRLNQKFGVEDIFIDEPSGI